MAQIIDAGFNTQNWLITPAVAQTSPSTWLVVLSGVAVATFTGVSGTEYTIFIKPDPTPAMNFAVTNLGAPKPAGPSWFLEVEQWAPYAAVGSTFDESHGTADAGFDVNAWRIGPFFSPFPDATTGVLMTHAFTGIEVDMSVRVSGPIVYRLPYNITLLAQFTSVNLFR
jgi:hypothetical protein